MTEQDQKDIARRFLHMGIQHWGQSDVELSKATEAYLRAAGFKNDIEGQKWLQGVLQNLRRGEFHDEVRQLVAALTTGKYND